MILSRENTYDYGRLSRFDRFDCCVIVESSRAMIPFRPATKNYEQVWQQKKNIREKEIQPSLKKELKLLAEQKMTVFFFLFFLNLGRQSIIVAFDIHHHHHHHHSSKEARQYHNGILIDAKRTKNPSSINPEIDLKSINAKVGWKTVRYFLFLFFFDFFFHQSFSFLFSIYHHILKLINIYLIAIDAIVDYKPLPLRI